MRSTAMRRAALLLGLLVGLPGGAWAQQPAPVYFVDLTGVAMPLSVDATHDAALATRKGPLMMGQCDDVATDAVDENDQGSVRIDCELLALLTRPVGLTQKRYISVGLTEDEFAVKTTAGVLMGVSASNAHATVAAFLKCTNLTAANTTPGTSAVFYSIEIPPAGAQLSDRNINVTFDTALTCYLVLGKADTAVDEVAATDIHVNITTK